MIADTSADVIPILIDHYVEESALRLSNITEAMNSKNVEQLEFETHTLGSAAFALGNRALAELAREIEKQCLQKQFDVALDRIPLLLSLAKRSIDALVMRKDLGFIDA
ncbi:Hpt domain-containing protein [Vibrio genomosp. F10 str. 9ZC157]|uniref:Phosphorelay protein LuxU n=1 Tax=Vibrio genomosp. F10 str. ZF-129 TaxID=1187848 RepID=A0A1E5BFF1_9VIBR|nr:Hpt domain-containing protein [Vibrio genomosp. F10]OEE34547.1 phosphorelay protein LuxU [Vibrio genomosp. F10 str. ZF-129]OEE93406.1 phosphorelay protein LuxU [Vibrio genomosp. F10 str. 9ZC157]